MTDVVFLNPRTCGIYKNGKPRFKTNPKTGKRTEEIDNELIEAVEAYLAGESSLGERSIDLEDVFKRKVLVPTYYDERYDEPISPRPRAARRRRRDARVTSDRGCAFRERRARESG